MNDDVTEPTLQVAVIEAMHATGWLVAHFRPARTKDGEWRTPVAADGKGFFDLVAINLRQGRQLLVELKGAKGKRSPEQEVWGEHAEAVAARCENVEYHVWRPEDWPERIMAVLAPSR